jgi:predicted phosphodiesterase
MKLGVIADIHGNEPALRAVLDDAARQHVDQ